MKKRLIARGEVWIPRSLIFVLGILVLSAGPIRSDVEPPTTIHQLIEEQLKSTLVMGPFDISNENPKRHLVAACVQRKSDECDTCVVSRCLLIDLADNCNVIWQSDEISGTFSEPTGVRTEGKITELVLKIDTAATLADLQVYLIGADGIPTATPHDWKEELGKVKLQDLNKNGVAEVICEAGFFPNIYQLKNGRFVLANLDFPEQYANVEAPIKDAIANEPNPLAKLDLRLEYAKACLYQHHFDLVLNECDDAEKLLTSPENKISDNADIIKSLRSSFLQCRDDAQLAKKLSKDAVESIK